MLGEVALRFVEPLELEVASWRGKGGLVSDAGGDEKRGKSRTDRVNWRESLDLVVVESSVSLLDEVGLGLAC